MIPLYGFLQGDTLGILVFAYPDDTMKSLSDKLQSAASVRVRAREGLHVTYQGQPQDESTTVKQVGMTALDRFDVSEGVFRV